MKKVGIIMGSKSDLPVMQDAIDILSEFGIETEVNIVSAHRTPEKMFKYAGDASEQAPHHIHSDESQLQFVDGTLHAQPLDMRLAKLHHQLLHLANETSP